MNVSRITVGRVFNLGNYENVRYELSVDIPAGESAAAALVALENIVGALSPKTCPLSEADLKRDRLQIDGMHKCLSDDGPEEFKRMNGWQMNNQATDSPEEFIAKREAAYAEKVKKLEAWKERSTKARQLLDDLGGAAVWKDAKQDWEDDTEF